MRCQRRAVVAVLRERNLRQRYQLLLSIISQSLYQLETCELTCLKLRAPVSEKERADAGTGCVREKAEGGGEGLWGQQVNRAGIVKT